jgi:hypothetical protein
MPTPSNPSGPDGPRREPGVLPGSLAGVAPGWEPGARLHNSYVLEIVRAVWPSAPSPEGAGVRSAIELSRLCGDVRDIADGFAVPGCSQKDRELVLAEIAKRPKR